MFPDFLERMTKDLTALAPSTTRIKNVLPNGNIITVVAKRFWCVEILFLPASLAKGDSELHDTYFKRQSRVVTRHEHVP